MKEHTKTSKRHTSIAAVVDNCVCCGCGGCAVACPKSCITFEYGSRYNYPTIDAEACIDCGRCLKVCPSAFLLEGTDPGFEDRIAEATYDCYLAHYKDEDIRLNGSSGGGLTGVILHMMDKGMADGAIVTRCKGPNALVAESFIATDRQSLFDAQASKYAPVSSCVALKEALERPGRYVFVGMPCMVQSLSHLEAMIPELSERIVLKISMVCAGMASRQSTRAYIETGGVDIKDVRRVRYRGTGWPGRFRAYGEDDRMLFDRPLLGGSLVHVVPGDHYLRCWNCLDHWGKFADVVISDPWTEDMINNETEGWSAVMIRTQRGTEVCNSAFESGDLIAKPIGMQDMLAYNEHLLIDDGHDRHAWMASYQLVFHKRPGGAGRVLRALLKKRPAGLGTTLRARRDKQYYR